MNEVYPQKQQFSTFLGICSRMGKARSPKLSAYQELGPMCVFPLWGSYSGVLTPQRVCEQNSETVDLGRKISRIYFHSLKYHVSRCYTFIQQATAVLAIPGIYVTGRNHRYLHFTLYLNKLFMLIIIFNSVYFIVRYFI